MAITINITPDDYEPVYTNSMPFEISSTFQSSVNYKYLFNLYIGASITPVIISTYPRPTGYGIYSPHYALQANCNTGVGPDASTIKDNSGSKVEYYLKFGEQYNPGLTFADTDLATAYLGLTFSTNIASQFFVGDLITIQKDNIGINPWIDGTASVTALTSNYSIMTDKLKPVNVVYSSFESGSVINITRYSATSSIYYGWNAARQYGDLSDFATTYIMDIATEQSFLSVYETAYTDDLTESKPIYIGDYETLDIFVGTASFLSFPVVYCTYVYYDSTNAVLGNDFINYGGNDNGILRYVVPTGTQNIVDIGASGSVFISNGSLDHYEVIIGLGDGSNPLPDDDISRRFNYQIIPDCRPYDVVRLTFLNKLGGYDYWNFNLVSKYKSNIKRTQIDRALNPLVNGGDGERGRDVIYSTAVENWTINTDFLTDTDALFIRELVESSSVFIVETDGSILPVVISDSSWDFKSGLLNGYVQYTIEFQKSNDVIINR
jgi:hypothetical protein